MSTKKKSITIRIKGGETLLVPREMVYFVKELINNDNIRKGYQFDESQGVITFTYLGRLLKIKFYEDGLLNGEFASFFGDYEFLNPILGNTVIDIGANIADSSIWFAISGASKIIALEPYRYSYNMAIKNLEMNNLNDIVILLNAGYGRDGEIEVKDTIANIGSVLEEFKGGLKVPLLSLSSILNKYSRIICGQLLLKMDCEGCEYNILAEDEDTIKKFSRIVIEYHKGCDKIEEKLIGCNFDVVHRHTKMQLDKETNQYIAKGYLFAKNKNNIIT